MWLCTAHWELGRVWAQHMPGSSSGVSVTAFGAVESTVMKGFFTVIFQYDFSTWAYRECEYQHLWQGKGTGFCAMEKWPHPLMARDQQLSVHSALTKGCHCLSASLPLAGNDFILQMSMLVLWYGFHLIVKLLIYRSLLSECKQILVLKALLMHNVWILISSLS